MNSSSDQSDVVSVFKQSKDWHCVQPLHVMGVLGSLKDAAECSVLSSPDMSLLCFPCLPLLQAYLSPFSGPTLVSWPFVTSFGAVYGFSSFPVTGVDLILVSGHCSLSL